MSFFLKKFLGSLREPHSVHHLRDLLISPQNVKEFPSEIVPILHPGVLQEFFEVVPTSSSRINPGRIFFGVCSRMLSRNTCKNSSRTATKKHSRKFFRNSSAKLLTQFSWMSSRNFLWKSSLNSSGRFSINSSKFTPVLL